VIRLGAGRSGFDSWQVLGIFLLAIAPRPNLGPKKPPVRWVSGVKRPGSEADHSPPPSAENAWSYTSTAQ